MAKQAAVLEQQGHNKYDRRGFFKVAGLVGGATLLEIFELLQTGCAPIPKEDLVSLRKIIIPGVKDFKRKGPDIAQTPAGARFPGASDYRRHIAGWHNWWC